MSDYRYAHPALKSRNTNLWFGEEIEIPSLKGAKTAFIANSLTTLQLESLELYEPQQLFFTETFQAWGWYMKELRKYASDKDIPVTCAIPDHQADQFIGFRDHFFPEVSIVVRVFSAKWAMRLQHGQDRITVGVPYNMLGFELTEQVAVVTRDMYTKDSEHPQ